MHLLPTLGPHMPSVETGAVVGEAVCDGGGLLDAEGGSVGVGEKDVLEENDMVGVTEDVGDREKLRLGDTLEDGDADRDVLVDGEDDNEMLGDKDAVEVKQVP